MIDVFNEQPNLPTESLKTARKSFTSNILWSYFLETQELIGLFAFDDISNDELLLMLDDLKDKYTKKIETIFK